MNHQEHSWHWGARPAIVALVGVVVGYLTNVVSGGNHSVAAVAGFGCAVVAFIGLVWWDSVRQAGTGTTVGPPIVLDQHVGTVRDGSVTAVEADHEISGDLRQRVDLAERSDVTGIRRVPPGNSQGRP